MADQPRRGRRLSRWALLDLVALAAATYLIGRHAHAFTGFPKGYDAWGHLSKARMIADNWPHVNWNDEWYAGQPAFQGSYPPGYHVLVVAVATVARCSLATAMVAVAAAATVAAVCAVYTLVLAVTRSRTAGLLAATLVLGTATFWDQIIELGLYPRTVSFDLALVAVAAAALHRHSSRKRSLVACALLLSAALSTHPVSGGIGVVLVALVLLAPAPLGPPRRIAQTAVVVAAAVGVAGYFYLPLLLQPRSQSAFTDHEEPVRLASLLWPRGGDFAALQPLLLPGTLALAAGLVVFLRRRTPALREVLALGTDLPLLVTPPRPGEPVPAAADAAASAALREHWRVSALRRRHRASVAVVVGLLACVAGVLGYCLIGYAVPRFPLYVNGLQPRDLLVYPAVLLAAGIGISLHVLADRPSLWRRGLARGSALAAAVGVVALLVPTLPSGVRDAHDPTTSAMIGLLPADAHDSHDYRIAGTTDGTTRFINAVTGTAQTRGYDDHGNLHLDWQYWLEHAFSDPSVTPAQRAFLARWYAVKWSYSDDTGKTSALAGDPHFARIGEEHLDSDVSLWQAKDAAPIVTPVTAPTVLVVGDAAHYDVLLRALSMADIDDRVLVPVHGPAGLDDVSPRDLAGFDVVMVYGATVGDRGRDRRLLADYLAGGGGVFVDAADGSAGQRLLAPGGPLPVVNQRADVAAGEWGFRAGGDALATSANVAAWAPPVFGANRPWSVVTARTLASWAHPVLSLERGPVVAAGTVGKGAVVWSGLNLPYHAAAFGSAPEARFLAAALRGVARPAPSAGSATGRWVDPEDRLVTVAPGTRGVLVREYVTPDWHATVGGREARIWPAGPAMMYVAVPAGASGAVTIDLSYRLGPVEHVGIAVSLLSALGVLLWCVPGPVRRLRQRLAALLAHRVERALGQDPLDVPPVRVCVPEPPAVVPTARCSVHA